MKRTHTHTAIPALLGLAFLFLALALGEPSPAQDQAGTGSTTRGRILDERGAVLAESADGLRRYPAENFGHVTGYLRADGKGALGIEKTFDAELAQGRDVTLTIDARVQKIAADHFPEDKDGAVIVIRPENGAIVALASFSAFDSNDFVGGISEADFKRYQDDPRRPLLNRAIQPASPGSTYKLVTALAAVEAGLHEAIFPCTGGVDFGNKWLKCWGTHGGQDLSDSIKNSCSAYYYQLAREMGFEPLDKTARRLGLLAPTGCGLPGEGTGALTSAQDAESHGHDISPASAAIGAIGQGYTVATPLQMASFAATLANGKKVHPPRLVAAKPDETPSPIDLSAAGFPDEPIQQIRLGMWRAVNEEGGTAPRARSEIVEIAGKTGTAQAWRPDGTRYLKAWFVGFAPYENPGLAICVYVDDGQSGGATAAPVAAAIIEEALALSDP